MPKHDVTFTIPARPLSYADISFVIKKDGEAFGTLKMSKGGPEWQPKRGKSQKVSWTTVANWIEAHRDGKLDRRGKSKTQVK
jgi:hypothetical protein